jgi:hypothetical protein
VHQCELAQSLTNRLWEDSARIINRDGNYQKGNFLTDWKPTAVGNTDQNRVDRRLDKTKKFKTSYCFFIGKNRESGESLWEGESGRKERKESVYLRARGLYYIVKYWLILPAVHNR